jgi:hypothetical protein
MAIHYSGIYIERVDDTLYFCHRGKDYWIEKEPVPLYDADGNFVTYYRLGYEDKPIHLSIGVNDYNNAKNGHIVKNGYDLGYINEFYVSHNYRPLKVKKSFEVLYNDYCESRQIMQMITCYLGGNDFENGIFYDYGDNYFELSIDSPHFEGIKVKNRYYNTYINRTINNSFPIECIGIGGKAMFVKVHKSLKPILYHNYNNVSDDDIPYEFRINKKFIEQYFDGKKTDTIKQKLNCSIKFLQNWNQLKGLNKHNF